MRLMLKGLLLAGLAAIVSPAAAQNFPDRTVTIVVPFAPGGVTDVAARIAADGLEKKWGKPVIVENLPGAGGITGTQKVIASAPDGYTLLFQTTTLPGYPVFQKSVPFDPLKDLTPITLFVDGTLVLSTSADAPFKTFEEMVTYVKANPGTINYASTGPGVLMLNMESINRQFGLDMQQVSYKSAAENYTALLSGEVQLALPDIARAKEDVAAGKVIMLGATGTQRSHLAPDTPTLSELGAKNINGYWSALFAPPGTPRDIVDKIQHDLAEFSETDEGKEKLTNFTFITVMSTPEELTERLASDIANWSEIVEAAGIEKK